MEPVIKTERHGAVRVITLNRPEKRNALNNDLAQALATELGDFDQDSTASVAVLTGTGRGFCAGMDLEAFASGSGPDAISALLERGCRKPMVAAVEGFAVAGGLELALVCDLIVAGSSARFGVPEVKRGLLAAGGGLIRLPARVPYCVAAELALTGDLIPADRALAAGLINAVVPDGSALSRAVELAETIADNAPLSLVASKKILSEAAGRTEEEMWQRQAPDAERVFRSSDAKEGAVAFAEKRAPIWSGT